MGLAGLLLLVAVTRPALHLVHFWSSDRNEIKPIPPGYADDMSRMNQTRVAGIWQMPADPARAESALRTVLRQAKAAGLRVSIAGARHSQGGQTIYPGGIQIDMLPYNYMHLDEAADLLHVGAGARWADIVPYLDAHGRSVSVMQSDNAFSVGGSLSVNCHGWQFDRPPIASTVESFRLMKADGTVVRCSRHENPELFSLALGGYGLFGVILDVDLHVVRNERLQVTQYVVPTRSALEFIDQKLLQRPDARMVYARLNVTPERMFEDVLIDMFYPQAGPLPALAQPGSQTIARSVFRGSVGSDYGKRLRWSAETKLQPYLRGHVFSRNQLLNDSPNWYLDTSGTSTDILQEYFVPRSGALQFLQDARKILGTGSVDLLNVTVRDVGSDPDSFMRYATQPVIAFVMFFSQPRTPAGDAVMEGATRHLIDAALKAGGRYYLPYRLHATVQQFYQAYPQAGRFFELKRRYDPGELFQNEFYTKYGKASVQR